MPPVPDLAKVYPYVVPSTYLDHRPSMPPDTVLPLGHGLCVILVEDYGSVCSTLVSDQIAGLGLTAEAIHARAMENLENRAQSQDFSRSLHESPSGLRFLVVTDHWLSASCILLPRLYHSANKLMCGTSFRVTIPHRELMIVYRRGTEKQETEFLGMVKDNEAEARKPLTWGLFDLTSDGLHACDQ